jgi:hypothetical protein
MVDHVGDLAQVYHEGALRDGQSFYCGHASEDSVCQSHPRSSSWDVRTAENMLQFTTSLPCALPYIISQFLFYLINQSQKIWTNSPDSSNEK